MNVKGLLCCGIAAASMMASGANAATKINLIDLGGVTGSQSEQGFKIAANFWERVLTNDVTINLGVSYAKLAPNVIGSTGSTRRDTTVSAWKNGVLNTRSNYTLDQTAVLPTLNAAGGVSFIGQGTRPAPTAADPSAVQQDTNSQVYIDGDTVSSKVLYLNTSVQKAVGIYTGSSTARDGNVTFSTDFSFDFDPTNGIDADKMDFIGVAIHEIGHALGFVSGVDLYDVYGYPNGVGGSLGYDLNDTSVFSALDMFRYSNDPNNVAPGAGPSLDLTVRTASYFSIDGGQTQVGGNSLFSTGAYNGDGRQASHFKDTPSNQGGCDGYNQLGILDPTFCRGEMGVVKGLDLAAYDAMGWNINFDVLNSLSYNRNTAQIYVQALGVPEPASWALMIGGFGLVGSAMRRRIRSASVSFA